LVLFDPTPKLLTGRVPAADQWRGGASLIQSREVARREQGSLTENRVSLMREEAFAPLTGGFRRTDLHAKCHD
jgi:hypothetical protein